LLEFSQAQNIDSGQRFPGLGSEPPQTGHTFFALGAFYRMEFDSFDFFRLQSVTHAALPIRKEEVVSQNL
jgi:hypothetical protein